MSDAHADAGQLVGDRITEAGYLALPDAVSERLFGLIMSLTAEVWTVRDRLRLAEAALTEHGIDVGRLIDDRRGTDADLAAMRADRDAFVARVMRAVSGQPAGTD